VSGDVAEPTVDGVGVGLAAGKATPMPPLGGWA